MNFSSIVYTWLPHLWLLRWQDYIEIICYALVIYSFSWWLQKDTQKNLVVPFYGYCVALCASHLLGFFTIHFLLIYAAPFAFMLFILFHQQTLQKNFITSTKQTNLERAHQDWIEVIMQGCLHAINTNKPIHLCIEQGDMIQSYLQTPLLMNVALEISLLELLLDSARFDASKMIVIERSGYLKSINASWHTTATDVVIDEGDLDAWQKYCLAITHKTDALFIQITPENRLFTLIMQGTILEHIPAATLVTILKSSLYTTKGNKKNNSLPLKGVFNESFTQKSSFKQTQS